MTIPISAAQHRATAGAYQNQLFENNRRSNRRSNITHTSVINRDSQHVQPNQHEFPLVLSYVGNSPDTMSRPTNLLTLRQSTALLFLQLLSQIRPADNPLSAASGNSELDSVRGVFPNTPLSDNSGNGFSTILSPVANALYETGQFIARNDPLKFPVADASPVPLAETESTTVASVVRDLKGDSYIITDEQKKNELISSMVQYLVSDGQITADESKNVELWLRSEAADMPMVAAHLNNEEVDISRKKRALAAENDPRIAEHIKGHCAFEEEVLDAQGENQGKVLIFQAQRAENPFRIIYDNNPDGRPSPEERGVADGLNLSADILTLGLKPLIGQLIANAKRREYYQNQGDEICAERFKRLFIAEVATSLDVDGLTFTRRGSAGKVRPSELRHALPEQERAAFFTRNPLTGIRKEILLELKQGKGAINDNGRQIYLKPTEKKNEFVTYHPDAVRPELLERRVIVDENNLSWRYADSFDSSGLNVEISEGKQQIRLHGKNHELHQNGAGKYEIVVKKASGIKEFVPVYMEPLSRTWHLNTHNAHTVFSTKQADIIKEIKVNKKEGFYYIPRGNNNQKYYGNGNIYVQEKMGDSGHYPWGRYVEMNGELVPVRNTQRQGQGVLYEVYDMKFPEKAGHPIEWDCNRWLFERKTSVHVSKDLKNLISPEMVAEKVDAGKLSAPDHQGLRYDADGNKYIKVRNKYVRINTHKHGVFTIKANDNNVLFLRFKHNKFRPETINERLSVILRVGLSGRGKGFANLPLKEHKMSDFKISGQNKDLLFPEYGVHLENKQPDLVDYAAKFEQLTPSEKESIHKWTMKPSNEEIPDSLKLNMYLREEVKLTDELNTLDKNLSSALSRNLPKKTGDMIRFEQYFSDEKNPWLNGNLKVGDYLSDRGYLSFSGKDNLIKNVMIKNIKTQDKKLTCHVFYRVKNANNGFYLPEKIATTGKNVDEVLYNKGQVYKINDISIAFSKKAGEPHRVAVDLEEVKPDETIPVNIENWHIGKSEKIDRPASFSLSLSYLLDSGPSVPKKRRQQ